MRIVSFLWERPGIREERGILRWKMKRLELNHPSRELIGYRDARWNIARIIMEAEDKSRRGIPRDVEIYHANFFVNLSISRLISRWFRSVTNEMKARGMRRLS
jgi:hypothetical protein